MNLWGHPGFLPYPLINFQGRNPGNFWLAFWEKRWHHKFFLNLTDLYKDLPTVLVGLNQPYWSQLLCQISNKIFCGFQWQIFILCNRRIIIFNLIISLVPYFYLEDRFFFFSPYGNTHMWTTGINIVLVHSSFFAS